MKIKIDAVDTLFFKDGKPFTMGEEVWASSMFPPPPSVIYGALRSHYFGLHPEEISKANTAEDPTKDLVLNFFGILVDGKLMFPTPLDLLFRKDANPGEDNLLKTGLVEFNGVSNYAYKYLLRSEQSEKVDSVSGSYINLLSLKEYLSKSEGTLNALPLSQFISNEPKTGIGRSNSTRSAEDGKLFRTGMKRPSVKGDSGEIKLSFIVDFSGLELPGEGIMKLGGEGKAATYSAFTGYELPEPVSSLSTSSNEELLLKLYFASHAIFDSGSVISGKLIDSLGKTVEVIASATGRAVNIGGFDLKHNKPKEMKKAIPAGSVYFLKITNPNHDNIKSLHGSNLSTPEFAKQGYGTVLVGVV